MVRVSSRPWPRSWSVCAILVSSRGRALIASNRDGWFSLTKKATDYDVSVPSPTPTRPAVHFPGVTGYRTPRSGSNIRRLPGRGGPPQFPPPPSIRSAPHTPGSSSRLRSRLCTASMAFAPISRGSALPCPPGTGRMSNDAAGFASCYGPHRRSPIRASDAGLRPGPFPDRAASLLPGLLTGTPLGRDRFRVREINLLRRVGVGGIIATPVIDVTGAPEVPPVTAMASTTLQ